MPLLRLPYDEMGMQLAQEIVEAIPGAEIIDEGEGPGGMGGEPAMAGGPGGPGGGPEDLMAMLGGGGGPGGPSPGGLGGGLGGGPPGLPGGEEDMPPTAPRRRRPDPSAIRPV